MTHNNTTPTRKRAPGTSIRETVRDFKASLAYSGLEPTVEMGNQQSEIRRALHLPDDKPIDTMSLLTFLDNPVVLEQMIANKGNRNVMERDYLESLVSRLHDFVVTLNAIPQPPVDESHYTPGVTYGQRIALINGAGALKDIVDYFHHVDKESRRYEDQLKHAKPKRGRIHDAAERKPGNRRHRRYRTKSETFDALIERKACTEPPPPEEHLLIAAVENARKRFEQNVMEIGLRIDTNPADFVRRT